MKKLFGKKSKSVDKKSKSIDRVSEDSSKSKKKKSVFRRLGLTARDTPEQLDQSPVTPIDSAERFKQHVEKHIEIVTSVKQQEEIEVPKKSPKETALQRQRRFNMRRASFFNVNEAKELANATAKKYSLTYDEMEEKELSVLDLQVYDAFHRLVQLSRRYILLYD